MFKIGEFSKISRVPVKTLRYYDEIGLLRPARTDDFTGYRYYAIEQLARLNRILALKDLGFALEQIARLLDGNLSPDHMRELLAMRQAELRERVRQVRLERYHEGPCAQILHTGPYSAEPPTIERLHAFIAARGYRRRGKHHEIYLGDPRQTAPEKLKTIIRQPVAAA